MPTVQQIPGPYRVYFYSFDCAEPAHAHIQREKMVCKFWLDPLMLCDNHGFTPHELRKIRHLLETHHDQIMEAWYEHCGENPDHD